MIAELNCLGKAGVPFLFIIDFDIKRPVFIPLTEIKPDWLLFAINNQHNIPPVVAQTATTIRYRQATIRLNKYPVSYTDYKLAFDRVQLEQRAGNSYLLNLTFPTRLEVNLNLREIFLLSNAKYKLWFRDKFVVFSPETFVTINNGIISAYPMKGTIDADIPDAANCILQDEKEMAEHITIVDLIRNDLGKVARHVRVKRFRYIEQIRTPFKTLLQVSSEITGELTDDYASRLGEILYELLPAGSVTGAPKKKTVEIIKTVEGYERGYYTGIFGYFDGKNLDSGVMIRFIEKENTTMIYKSGGGITIYSQPEAEYQELLDKIYVPLA